MDAQPSTQDAQAVDPNNRPLKDPELAHVMGGIGLSAADAARLVELGSMPDTATPTSLLPKLVVNNRPNW